MKIRRNSLSGLLLPWLLGGAAFISAQHALAVQITPLTLNLPRQTASSVAVEPIAPGASAPAAKVEDTESWKQDKQYQSFIEVRHAWPLSLVFLSREQGHVVLEPGASIIIRTSNGQVLREAEPHSPFYMTWLAPGSYQMTASEQGKKVERVIDIGVGPRHYAAQNILFP